MVVVQLLEVRPSVAELLALAAEIVEVVQKTGSYLVQVRLRMDLELLVFLPSAGLPYRVGLVLGPCLVLVRNDSMVELQMEVVGMLRIPVFALVVEWAAVVVRIEVARMRWQLLTSGVLVAELLIGLPLEAVLDQPLAEEGEVSFPGPYPSAEHRIVVDWIRPADSRRAK